MNRKLCIERYELVLSEIHEGLCSLLRQTRGVKTMDQSPAELEQMISYAAEIRHLLAELERMQVWSQEDALGRSLSELKRQFLDFEGGLKEQRNDHTSMS
jgi:hypothetical protein